MSDRLKDLQRQRALAQEQLAWFDREIAREMGAASAPTPTVGTLPPAPTAVLPVEADELIEQYAQKERPVREQVKQGCLLYLGIAFAFVGLVVLALYLHYRLK